VNQHSELSIKYKASEGDIKVELKRIYPSLTLKFVDYFDPLITYYDIQIGATGGNPPYLWSLNGSEFSSYPTPFSLIKSTTNTIVVQDSIGLTASNGYYIINGVEDYKYSINGSFTY
jgi:hypothetical protein